MMQMLQTDSMQVEEVTKKFSNVQNFLVFRMFGPEKQQAIFEFLLYIDNVLTLFINSPEKNSDPVQIKAFTKPLILRAFPTRATRLSSLLSESSEREISKLSN